MSAKFKFKISVPLTPPLRAQFRNSAMRCLRVELSLKIPVDCQFVMLLPNFETWLYNSFGRKESSGTFFLGVKRENIFGSLLSANFCREFVLSALWVNFLDWFPVFRVVALILRAWLHISFSRKSSGTLDFCEAGAYFWCSSFCKFVLCALAVSQLRGLLRCLWSIEVGRILKHSIFRIFIWP